MPTRRTRLLAPHHVACSLLVAGTVCINWSSVLAETPKFGAILSETPLVALVPREEPLDVLPRVSIAETSPIGEHWSNETYVLAASPAFLMPLSAEDFHTALVPMPPVPHWSEQLTACPGVLDDCAGSYDFLNPNEDSWVTLLDPLAEVERNSGLALHSSDDLLSPWSTRISAPKARIALMSKSTLEPLSIDSMPSRPVTPSGTMYLWSTTSEMRAVQGHTAIGTSAGVVLTRPPGIYSIDWIGFAVTAPIQWR